MAFTFASASAASNQAGMQNTLKPGIPSFSSAPASSQTTTMPSSGFSAFSMGFSKPGGGFASGTGIGNTVTSGAASAVGLPSSTGFGFASTGSYTNALGASSNAQLPPYKGIKGPGYMTTWQNAVDFSQINDHTLFSSLPPTLQQHLMELHAFASKEEESIKAVTDYLNDIKFMDTVKNTANVTANKSTGSYRHLSRQIAELKGGSRAVSMVAVNCEQHEKEVQSFSQHLDQFECVIREYQHQVWESLLASGDLTRAKGNPQTKNSLKVTSSFNRNVVMKSPLFLIIEELQGLMKMLNSQIEELRMDVVPASIPNYLVNGADATTPERSLGANTPSVWTSRGDGGTTPRYSNPSSINYVNWSGQSRHSASLLAPLNAVTATVAAAGVTLAPSSETVSQINASLGNLTTSLLSLSSWADHLHRRADVARGGFARQYGQHEADELFKLPLPSSESVLNTPGLSASILSAANPVSVANPAPVAAAPPASVGVTAASSEPNFSVVNTATNAPKTAGAPVGGFAGFGQGSPSGLFGGGKTKFGS